MSAGLGKNLLRYLIGLGLTPTQLLDVVEAIDADEVMIVPPEPISKGAMRTRKWRAKTQCSEDHSAYVGKCPACHVRLPNVTGDVTVTSQPSLPEVSCPPDPPNLPNPPSQKEPPKGGSKKGSRLPPFWQPSEGDRDFAKGLGFTAEQIELARSEFVDYWIAVPGAKGNKLDWSATWRNSCRMKGPPKPRGGQGPPPWAPKPVDWGEFNRLIEERKNDELHDP